MTDTAPSSLTDAELRDAYEQTDYITPEDEPELVADQSIGAKFSIDDPIEDFDRVQEQLSDAGYTCLDPALEDMFWSKVYTEETNEFFHIRVFHSTLLVDPKSKDFSYDAFAGFVRTFEQDVAPLTLAESND